MDRFFPEKLLGEIFWHEPLPSASENTSIPDIDLPTRIEFEQGSFDLGPSSSQNLIDEALPPSNQSAFIQHMNIPRIGFGHESSQNIPLPSASESTSIPDIELSTRIEFEQGSFDLGPSSSQNLIDEALPPSNQSVFIQYINIPRIGFGHESSQNVSNSQNLNNRLIGFLRRSCPVDRRKIEEYERERGFRHMINERMRRQRQKQCCIALHSMLPNGTKTDSNSVVSMATREIKRLQSCREELQRENFGLEGTLKALVERKRVGGTKIQFMIPNSTSGIDSMVEVLKCLKSLGVNIKSINTNFSSEELFGVLETETEIADGEGERIIERTLKEVEWKLQIQFLK